MYSHRRVPPSYFFFLLPFVGFNFDICLRARSTSLSVQSRALAPPTLISRGGRSLPWAIARCKCGRRSPSILAASAVENFRIGTSCTTTGAACQANSTARTKISCKSFQGNGVARGRGDGNVFEEFVAQATDCSWTHHREALEAEFVTQVAHME